MTKKYEPEQPKRPANLLIAKDEAKRKIEDQIAKGEGLLARPINSEQDLESLKSDRRTWSDFNRELLLRVFDTDEVSKEYSSFSAIIVIGPTPFPRQVRENQDSIKASLERLRSVVGRLDLYTVIGEVTKPIPSAEKLLANLHRDIYSKCHELYEKGAYAEAAEKGFKVVRDRLRTLTGYETGSEAFGKTKLHVKGAAAQNVDEDFNEAVKFLTMSIDRFRNEKSHTSDAKIDDPIRAYEYLRLSSLAMNLLEDTEMLS